MKRILRFILVVIMIVIILMVSVFVIRDINKADIKESDREYSEALRVNNYLRDNNTKNISHVAKKIRGSYLNGYHYIPNEKRHSGTIITFGGSEGGNNENIARYLATDGHEVLALYYFGQSNQNDKLEKVPIDFFEEVLEYIDDEEPITVIGGSRGAELALLLSSYYEEIDNLVLYSPSAYVFQGTYVNNPVSAWTYKGKEVDYLSLNKVTLPTLLKLKLNTILYKPYEPRIIFDNAVSNTDNLEDYRIKVEDIDANIIMFYGDDDKLWDAESMASVIEKHSKKEVKSYGYEGVGHTIGGPRISEYMNLGGKTNNNIEAYFDSNSILLETLFKWHN